MIGISRILETCNLHDTGLGCCFRCTCRHVSAAPLSPGPGGLFAARTAQQRPASPHAAAGYQGSTLDQQLAASAAAKAKAAQQASGHRLLTAGMTITTNAALSKGYARDAWQLLHICLPQTVNNNQLFAVCQTQNKKSYRADFRRMDAVQGPCVYNTSAGAAGCVTMAAHLPTHSYRRSG
jgi:hypothetical protein